MCKTVAVISGEFSSTSSLEEAVQCAKQSRSNAAITPMQAVPSDGHDVTRRREGSVFEEVDSFLRPQRLWRLGRLRT